MRLTLTALTVAIVLAGGAVLMLPGDYRSVRAGGSESITSPDTDGSVGSHTSLQLDGSGYPVVSYYDIDNFNLKLIHCNDANCSGGDESITSPDTGSSVGQHTSLQLDASGNPVVSYHDLGFSGLSVLHCDDPNCSGGGDSMTMPDSADFVGLHTSLQLDANGYPVISYYDQTNGALKIIHCNDPNCSGDDESISTADTNGNVGIDTSLQLDGNGYPVVSYYDQTNSNLKLLHCNDANCTGGDESITAPDTTGLVGQSTSLQLDATGNPVVSYFDDTNDDLKLLHCNDANCTGGDESITSPDTADTVGTYTSLQIDSDGNPVVAYGDATNGDLKILHCNDPNCIGGDSITAPDGPDFVGTHPSLQLDATGNPVVAYRDDTNLDLKILRCNDPDCSDATPTPTPTATPTPTPTSTPTPTASPNGTSTPTGTPSDTHTPTPTGPTPTPTGSPAPTPTPTPGLELAQGDNDCDGDQDSVDALTGLRHIAGLATIQQPACPGIGEPIAAPASEPPELFGDVDCDGDVDAVDQLKILQFIAAIPFTQNEPCTDLGDPL